MKKTLAVAALFVTVLAPAGTAFAGDTGSGNAYGNCRNSSQGGVHAPLADSAGNGNGGHSAGDSCRRPDTPDKPTPSDPS